jgi:hypothetical protein
MQITPNTLISALVKSGLRGFKPVGLAVPRTLYKYI